jgi:hypothetical protein
VTLHRGYLLGVALLAVALLAVALLGAAALYTHDNGALTALAVTPSPSRTTAAVMSPIPSPAAAASSRPKTAATTKPARTGHRQVTFVNQANQTIWVASGEQTKQPALPVTGWVLTAGQTVTISVPDKWNGRFWGRTGCSFDASGKGRCQTGDCAGRFQCKQYGQIPATLAEFNLNSWQNLDFYDVSMVDGANLPMYINIAAGATKDPIDSTGCAKSGCTRPVDCPAELRTAGGGCGSACSILGGDQYCCQGQWAPRSACDPTRWPVNYAAVFKKAEPFAYSYVDDDATSTFTCAGECGYRITFGLTP